MATVAVKCYAAVGMVAPAFTSGVESSVLDFPVYPGFHLVAETLAVVVGDDGLGDVWVGKVYAEIA